MWTSAWLRKAPGWRCSTSTTRRPPPRHDRRQGGESDVFTCDVTDDDQVAAVVDEVQRRWSCIDVLFNNVGVAGPTGTVVDVDLRAWDRCLAMNLTSTLIMSRHVIPGIAAGGGGSLITCRPWQACADERVLDVPAKLAALARLLGSGSARKTDVTDAASVGAVGQRNERLRSVQAEDHTVVLRLLSDRRDDLVAERTRTLNRLHVLLRDLHPGGAKRDLSTVQAAALLRAEPCQRLGETSVGIREASRSDGPRRPFHRPCPDPHRRHELESRRGRSSAARSDPAGRRHAGPAPRRPLTERKERGVGCCVERRDACSVRTRSPAAAPAPTARLLCTAPSRGQKRIRASRQE